MSLALYRKYRPATFAELKGQEHVADPLQQALRNGRINHAYLFSGPRGCGKTSSARILARSLNCEEGPTADPCGKCDSCVALGPAGNGHIDVIEIDAASHGGVDDARDLRERAFFAPVSARFKVYIIDEAHMVTREGFNALLKLVEEPPPHLKFVFATTEPEKVIGTIRSRTHHYPFRLMPPGVLRELLEEILRSEEVPFEPAALPLVVRAGAGSARDSLSILDQLLAGADDAGITYAGAVSLLGYTDASLLDEVVDSFVRGDGGAVFAAIDRVIEGGQDPRRFAADLLTRFRDLVILSNVPEAADSGLFTAPPDELERMRSQASGMGPGELTRAADLLHTGLTEMRGATAPRLLLELVCARILLPAAYEDEASMFARLDRLERRVAMGGAPAAPAPAPASAGTVPARDDAGGRAEPASGRPAAAPSTGGSPSAPERERATGTGTERGGPAERSGSQEHGDSSGRGGSGQPGGPPERGGSGGSGGAPERGGSGRPGGMPEPGGSEGPGGAPERGGSGGPDGASGPGDASEPDEGRTASDGGERAGASQSPAAASEAPQGAPGGIDVDAVRRAWPDILDAVKRKQRVAWMVLMEGVQVASLEGNLLTLAFENEGKRKGFTGGSRDAVLREVLKEYMGVEWRIDTVLGGAGSAPARGRSGPPAPSGPAPSSGFSGAATPPAPAPPSPGGGGGRPAAPAEPRRGRWEDPPPPEAPPPPDGPSDEVPGPVDESEEVDPEGDADADGTEAEAGGMALIQRELGGRVIREIDGS